MYGGVKASLGNIFVSETTSATADAFACSWQGMLVGARETLGLSMWLGAGGPASAEATSEGEVPPTLAATMVATASPCGAEEVFASLGVGTTFNVRKGGANDMGG
jgi:hypothetical protein